MNARRLALAVLAAAVVFPSSAGAVGLQPEDPTSAPASIASPLSPYPLASQPPSTAPAPTPAPRASRETPHGKKIVIDPGIYAYDWWY